MVFSTEYIYTERRGSLLITHLGRNEFRIERPVHEVRDAVIEAHEVLVCDTNSNFENADVCRGSDSVVCLLKVEIRTAIKSKKSSRSTSRSNQIKYELGSSTGGGPGSSSNDIMLRVRFRLVPAIDVPVPSPNVNAGPRPLLV